MKKEKTSQYSLLFSHQHIWFRITVLEDQTHNNYPQLKILPNKRTLMFEWCLYKSQIVAVLENDLAFLKAETTVLYILQVYVRSALKKIKSSVETNEFGAECHRHAGDVQGTESFGIFREVVDNVQNTFSFSICFLYNYNILTHIEKTRHQQKANFISSCWSFPSIRAARCS